MNTLQPVHRSLPTKAIGLILATLLLANCGGNSGNSSDSGNNPGGGTPPIDAGDGPPAVNGAGCTAYGAPARATVKSSLDGGFDRFLTNALNICKIDGGEILSWTDANTTPRSACLITSPNASKSTPLPLLVWLHPTLIAEDAIAGTGLAPLTKTGSLSGDAKLLGFNLLLPTGRNIEQFLPAPLDKGIGWDHWYRNFNRGSAYMNADVAAIDHFIDVVKQRGIVDPKRIYMSGHSVGADMAALYGLNTPGIAATNVYSSISPYDDPADPCPQKASAINNTRPFFLTVRACDVGNACVGGQQFLNDLRAGVLPAANVSGQILDDDEQVVQACDRSCGPDNDDLATKRREQHNHTRWPKDRNDDFLAYLRTHPLP